MQLQYGLPMPTTIYIKLDLFKSVQLDLSQIFEEPVVYQLCLPHYSGDQWKYSIRASTHNAI